ncbi:glycoside hydrolase family 5 protein [Suillus fuscotomentosus]|uniref:Glycoside hydrolase family 5 protein n=1 Tax=Suillus fuscotomentosus TaxID=1912939 RepID=A0AAD4EL39_9AGAM|nr:glycoside hydrolase family 5 protein [Suillus fuscotomentosus]KAG1908090.1 glycoside hydrolase family 5 protein [Suillus fuscotomentosus]
MRHILTGLVLSITFIACAWAGQPTHIYGVNLGSWLVLELWMLPQGWVDMGGQLCGSDCSTCISTESAFAQAYPDTVNATFAQHWDTWFTQSDVDTLKAAGINTVRIPLGYWIVEDLVNRPHELYPQGGLNYLRRGLGWLQDAGIQVILDHHALPGVQTAQQMFTGNCTTDVQFYTPYNYQRALVWTAVMTTLSHLDPNFGSVFSIEAANEPINDASQTPGYGTFQENFVQTVRAVELTLGISVPSSNLSVSVSASVSNNFTAALNETSSATIFPAEVQAALSEAVPIIMGIGATHGLQTIFEASPFKQSGTPLVTNFMDMNWQYNNPSNPADVAIGPQAYDDHLYYSSAVRRGNDSTSYMTSICNLAEIQTDAALGNSPLWFGEWSLDTQFNATDEFLYQWADAQKLAYSKGAGWIYWNFKIEISNLTNGNARAKQWSYLEGLELGFFTQDPAAFHNPNVCAPYTNSTSNNTSTSVSNSTSKGTSSSAPISIPATGYQPLIYFMFLISSSLIFL